MLECLDLYPPSGPPPEKRETMLFDPEITAEERAEVRSLLPPGIWHDELILALPRGQRATGVKLYIPLHFIDDILGGSRFWGATFGLILALGSLTTEVMPEHLVKDPEANALLLALYFAFCIGFCILLYRLCALPFLRRHLLELREVLCDSPWAEQAMRGILGQMHEYRAFLRWLPKIARVDLPPISFLH